jgi:hypothetical protein
MTVLLTYYCSFFGELLHHFILDDALLRQLTRVVVIELLDLLRLELLVDVLLSVHLR